jgi:hypothetical protein
LAFYFVNVSTHTKELTTFQKSSYILYKQTRKQRAFYGSAVKGSLLWRTTISFFFIDSLSGKSKQINIEEIPTVYSLFLSVLRAIKLRKHRADEGDAFSDASSPVHSCGLYFATALNTRAIRLLHAAHAGHPPRPSYTTHRGAKYEECYVTQNIIHQ